MPAEDLTRREPEDLIPLSALQHFAFCRRQWALIHLEGLWADNVRTVEGDILHQRAHDDRLFEKRRDVLILRGLRVSSPSLGISGVCDVVEFHRDPAGIALHGREGLWLPCPVEYKRGRPKPDDRDSVQLCGQALCLEEMLACTVSEGCLYYGETRHREQVPITPELRARVRDMAQEMRGYMQRRHTPSARPGKACNACSLKSLCLPSLSKAGSVSRYIHSHAGEDG